MLPEQEGPSVGDRLACPQCGELMFASETRCAACNYVIVRQQPQAPAPYGRPAPGAPPGPGGPGSRDMGALQAEIASATKLVKGLCLLFGILFAVGALGLVVVMLLTDKAPIEFYGRGFVIAAVFLAAGIALIIHGVKKREWMDPGGGG